MDPGFAFSLDTGAAGITGGDISWNGTSINFVKSAIGFDLVGDGQSGYASLTQSALSTYVSHSLPARSHPPQTMYSLSRPTAAIWPRY